DPAGQTMGRRTLPVMVERLPLHPGALGQAPRQLSRLHPLRLRPPLVPTPQASKSCFEIASKSPRAGRPLELVLVRAVRRSVADRDGGERFWLGGMAWRNGSGNRAESRKGRPAM